MQAILVVVSALFPILQCLANFTDHEYASMPPVFHQDNYDNCMLLQNEALYCSFDYHLKPLHEPNSIWNTIQEVSKDNYNYRHDILRHWICVPLTCPEYKNGTNAELEEIINECYAKKMAVYGLKGAAQNIICDTNEPKYPLDWLDRVALLFFIIYVLFVAFCTSYELIYSPNQIQEWSNSNWGKIILTFSIIKNWNRLTSMSSSDDFEYLKPIQGMRFFNSILVILSHTAISSTMIAVSNTQYVESMNAKVGNWFLSSGPLCVSTFFFTSAAMLSYGIFSHFENKALAKSVLVLTFFNRYLRLAPAMGIVILFNSTWFRHLGDGPNWNKTIGKIFLACRRNWWTNMLFINNIVNKTDMCTPIFWYLALDTQYVILLLVLLWYIKKHEKYIWHILFSLLCINIIGTFMHNYVEDFEAFIIPRAEQIYEYKCLIENPQFHGQLASPFGNTCGPIIGVGFGYLLFKTKNVKLFQTNKTFWKILFFVFSYGPALAIILIPGWYIMVHNPVHNAVTASVIVTLGRPIFVAAIAFNLFGAIHKTGGPTEMVLKWQPACLLGRLSYSAYVVHMSLIISRPASARSPAYVSDLYMTYHLLGDVASAYLVGCVMTLLFEMPMSALQKILLSNASKNSETTYRKEK